jgi:L-asparaginase II
MPDAANRFLPVVEVVRNDVLESVHFGAVAVCDAEGRLEASLGESDVMTYLRSAAKPF